eukprot:Sspe_Gene.3387::Locus_1111_Transcript_1_3_Confidence_0.500_Length_1698::g.3387::m.3387
MSSGRSSLALWPATSARMRGTVSKELAKLRMLYWSTPGVSSAYFSRSFCSSVSTAPAPARRLPSLPRALYEFDSVIDGTFNVVKGLISGPTQNNGRKLRVTGCLAEHHNVRLTELHLLHAVTVPHVFLCRRLELHHLAGTNSIAQPLHVKLRVHLDSHDFRTSQGSASPARRKCCSTPQP